MAKVKTSRDVLHAIAQEKRYTRDQVRDLVADMPSWEENAEAWEEPFEVLAGLSVPDDLNTDGLDDVHVDGQSFEGITEAFEQLIGFKTAATAIRDALGEIEGLCSSFRDCAETWVNDDGDNDPDDIAQAKEEMLGAAGALDEKLSELDDYNIDLSTER
ncbi:hypothetical protein [Nocardia sp. NPDC051570]|uniref:hypothetical protein n=1 Tax=Nocardia sp. NPDC051570 TaxID=3364324 RepID=UPI0037AEEAB6